MLNSHVVSPGLGPIPVPVAMAAMAAAFVMAGLTGLWAWGLDPGAGRAMLTAAAGAMALVGAMLVGAWAMARGRVSRARASFFELFATAPKPAMLTDAEGMAIEINAAMREGVAAAVEDGGGSADARGSRRLAASVLLRPFSDEPGALAYRLIAAAREQGGACETSRVVAAGRRTAHAVAARRTATGHLLWTVEPAEDAAAPELATPRFGPEGFVESLPVALAQLSGEGTIIAANAAARALLGSKAAPGAPIGSAVEGLGRPMEVRVAEAMRGDSSGRAEIARSEPDGREVFLQVALTRADIDGDACLVAVLADATELKTLEAQFVQSQKMQAVGQLAGGVAHDFNNLLTAIAGHTDLLLQRHDHGDMDFADLTQVRQNANRAAALVRQLLAFSRKQTLELKAVNVVDLLSETSHLLNRLLGEKVSLRIEHAAEIGVVRVDERQFEQVIMNLAVNARDAMPGGGVVRIRTGPARIEAEHRRGRAVMPRGDYVRIDVGDSGVGIPADKIDQIFEPFFTTKPVGEGTGLGLSTVYGIVKQTGGFVFAESAPGQGSTFSIYLPRAELDEIAPPAPARPAHASADLTGRGVVLLIEDETPVRAFAARALKLRGYEVLEAASGEEALDMLADPALAIDVIVSDVVMPGMDGPSCVREARKARPDVKVVFVSGYAEDALKRSMAGIGACHFLAKPFSLNELTAKVKECVSA